MNYLVILFMTLTAMYPIDIKLEYLKYKSGCDFVITSGNRTIGHNIKVGGSEKSRHLVNKGAYDLRKTMCKLTYYEIGILARDIFGGVIVYKDHIHVDIRDRQLFIEFLR